MRDRQTMARRVRGYVTSGKGSHGVTGGPAAAGAVTSRERKALATMGSRGGKKDAQRWQDDPDGDYARAQREKLNKTVRRKVIRGQTTRARIQAFIGQQSWRRGLSLPVRRLLLK